MGTTSTRPWLLLPEGAARSPTSATRGSTASAGKTIDQLSFDHSLAWKPSAAATSQPEEARSKAVPR